ncbi:bifunctional folylpolyglutamate synthase/dihydrofolate synthase [Candidatus Fermentibacteria bacterium]|nr:bifunctional folylpolyglutamate synthase/dihydrofolate synthase [Candidatus Fermentibacteria bacterium]
MTLAEAQQFLYSFVNWEKKGGRPTEAADLTRFRRLLHTLDDPHHRFRSVLVVGTNGKGSVSAMLASMLRAGGLRVGLYTSPHLVSITERIQVEGRPISDEDFAAGVTDLKGALGPLPGDAWGYRTTFELLTALAFRTFAASGVDVAVVEAGLGARLDATAVVDPVLSIITPIHLDHTATLGRTLREIARDKAGVIRPEVGLVTAPQTAPVRAVIREEAEAVGPAQWIRVGVDTSHRWWRAGDGYCGAVFSGRSGRVEMERLPLRGAHQVVNAAAAVAAARMVMPDAHPGILAKGLARTCWPGRMEVVPGSPPLLLDGAHNPHGARTLARFLGDWDRGGHGICTILAAISMGKDVRGVLEPLRSRSASLVACRVDEQRGVAAEEIVRCASALGFSVTATDLPDALQCARARADSDGLVVVCGSLYLVGAIAAETGVSHRWWG